MYTKLTTDLGEHIFDPGGMLSYSPKGPGKEFLGFCGSAYEEEWDGDRAAILEAAKRLLAVLRDPTSEFFVDAPKFADQLGLVIAFLERSNSTGVVGYSWEDIPTLEQLLACEATGGGGDDWAMEVVSERAEEFFPELENVLADPGQDEHHLSAIRLLLFCYPRDLSVPIVETFVENTKDEERRNGAIFLLAATDPHNQK